MKAARATVTLGVAIVLIGLVQVAPSFPLAAGQAKVAKAHRPFLRGGDDGPRRTWRADGLRPIAGYGFA